MMDDRKVIVTKPVVGIFYMQVCVKNGTPDSEILYEANRQNPSGTSNGWMEIIKEDPGKPVVCGDDDSRTHYLLAC